MTEDGDELLPKFRSCPFVQQVGFRRSQPFPRLEVKGDETREHAKHFDGLGRQLGRPRVDGTQRPEQSAILEDDRHRNIALEAVHRRGRVMAIVFADMLDDDGLFVPAELMADLGIDLQLASRPQTELNLIVDRTAQPTLVRNPRDRRKAHSREATNDPQERRNRLDPAYGVNIRPNVLIHAASSRAPKIPIITSSGARNPRRQNAKDVMSFIHRQAISMS